MSASEPDLYRILGVPPTATPAEIRQAYRDRAWKAHPDVAADAGAGDMASINQAWKVLGDPGRRARHDQGLGQLSTSAWHSAPDQNEPSWTRSEQPSRVLSTPNQHLLRTILLTSTLSLLLIVVAIFLIGFGRVGS